MDRLQGSKQVMFRLSPTMLGQIDQYAASFHHCIGRSAAVRSLLHLALQQTQLMCTPVVGQLYPPLVVMSSLEKEILTAVTAAPVDTRGVDISSDLLVQWAKLLSLEESVLQWVVPYVSTRVVAEDLVRTHVDPSVGHLCALRPDSSGTGYDVDTFTNPGIYYPRMISHYEEVVVPVPLSVSSQDLSAEDRARELKPAVLERLRTWVHDHDFTQIMRLLNASCQHQGLSFSNHAMFSSAHVVGGRVLFPDCLRIVMVKSVAASDCTIILGVFYRYYLWAAWKQ